MLRGVATSPAIGVVAEVQREHRSQVGALVRAFGARDKVAEDTRQAALGAESRSKAESPSNPSPRASSQGEEETTMRPK